MKLLAALIIATISVVSMPAIAAYGTPFEGWGFVQDDWQVVCDNTLTCRAAGYAEEGQWDMPASILLTALSKEGLPTAHIQFLSETSDENYTDVELWLNGKNFGNLTSGDDGYIYDLTLQQVKHLINHARSNTKIEIRAGEARWTISDKGMSAVLLKLDEVQGRVGTSIALVSKNNATRQTLKAAKAKPVIKKAISYSDDAKQQLDPAKLVYFQKNINKWIDIEAKQLVGSGDDRGSCELVSSKTEEYQRMQEYSVDRLGWVFTPVDAEHTLAIHLCWRGAYNEGYGYWLINHAKPSKPELITTSGNEYSEGEISAIHKDRGIGDCWNRSTWIWNGQTFVKSEEGSTGLCRGFAGGAWSLPTYISEVIESSNMKNNRSFK